MRAEALPEDSAGSDESPDGSGDFSLRALARRVEQIKRDEARGTTTMPVIVLDATLPGQRLGLRFDRKDTRRALNAGTSLGPLAEVGDAFAMLGQAPRSGQVLPFGVEVTVSRVRDFPDGSGDVEVELVGRRRVRIEGQPFDENGVAMAKVAFMDFAPDAPRSADESSDGEGVLLGEHDAVNGVAMAKVAFMDFAPDAPDSKNGEDGEAVLLGEDDAVKGAHPAAATRGQRKETSGGDTDDASVANQGTREPFDSEANARAAAELAPLVSEWKALVREGGHERRKGQLDLIESHIGPMPPSGEPARVAAWVAALINPIPALGVAYEIRPALLMARDTRGMLRVAREGIVTSIERLRPRDARQETEEDTP